MTHDLTDGEFGLSDGHLHNVALQMVGNKAGGDFPVTIEAEFAPRTM